MNRSVFLHKHFKLFLFLLLIVFGSCANREVVLVSKDNCHVRTSFGKTKLVNVLEAAGYKVLLSDSMLQNSEVRTIIIGQKEDEFFKTTAGIEVNLKSEGFSIQSENNTITVRGADATGTLYACQELAERIQKEGKLPEQISINDQPEMVLRGTCIGLQKTEYLPGRHVYEYPYTPENFPWFYDREQWIQYLDMMVENRYNSLYLWNGHPFASLVKLADYPYAVEVDDETFKLNEEMFGFITEEANKRGIWVIQMFYNIIVSKPFAEHHGIKTQERSRPIIPLIADYTQKSVAAFIEKYPNVGLLVCLGEAMHTIDDDVEWFTKTIIPGVQDGLEKLGRTDEPPIVLRGHDTDGEKVMTAALPIYKNLYTMSKYNGESLTTYEPRDSWESIPRAMSNLGSIHISNVHILANLEPFRYGSPDFIQKSTQAMHDIQGANGLHLYPQTSYWDWPYTADKANPRINQIDRDWIWYKAWGRYAWDCRRDRNEEIDFWSEQLAGFYGCEKGSNDILEAYEQTGEIAPKLLRRFGISDGNRQTLLLGMFMSQLVNPHKWHVYSNFYSSNGPEGEILIDYARKEWNNEKHSGELPPQIIKEAKQHGRLAVEAIDRAAKHVTNNVEEFERLKNDVYCYNAFANFFYEKVNAAMWVLRYKYSNDVADLEKAVPYLEKSLEYWKELVALTNDTYLYANSMQTQQRRIPITGRNGTNKTWTEMLPHYQNELDNFKRNLETLNSGGAAGAEIPVLQPAKVKVLNKGVKTYSVVPGQKAYTDNNAVIEEAAEELNLLKGVQFSDKKQQEEGTVLQFENDKPVKVVVGYFNTNSYTALRPPTLETNAAANNRGQADIKIANAMRFSGLYPVNIYTYHYEAGKNELKLGKGRVLILGFIDGENDIKVHDAGISDKNDGIPVDWLFY
ncbi:hypothetical protein [uncultured Draconibacterium sp.]|uniref:alpha-d-galacturonidase n=1 Tax=uncultured Draconibacterium sp. TaxID=1573823 RepID=UPI003261C514